MLMDQTRVQNTSQSDALGAGILAIDAHIHLVGIGGSGMSAIAWHLLDRGLVVSGSDLRTNDTVVALAKAGARVFEGHADAHVSGADVVVISSAVRENNAEVRSAREQHIPVLKRADFLGYLMRGATGIAVAGTHGKTTTTSLIAHILLETGRDPSFIVGGQLPALGRNGRAGQGSTFVVEADEYDYMFLGLQPQIAVITTIEHDHPDLFATADEYLNAFRQFVGRLPADGTLVCRADDEGVRQLLRDLTPEKLRVVTYGLGASDTPLDFRIAETQPNQLGGSDFVVLNQGETVGLVRIRLPGEHNVSNALAAIAVCLEVGLTMAEISQALISFGGVGRRFQVVGEVGEVVVIDDYAHHPTEIRVTLAAARQRYPGRRLWAIWQPHTYSRTRLLMDEFTRSFEDADRVIVLDVYRSRESDTLGVDASQIVAGMDHTYARYCAKREEAARFVLDRVRPDDVVITLGAGDGNEVGQWILDGLRARTWDRQ